MKGHFNQGKIYRILNKHYKGLSIRVYVVKQNEVRILPI
jgi:hypothetical protein